jgi:MFS family permease
MLNEAPPHDRTVAQGLITIFTGVGQLVGGASIGAVVTSAGGGVAGYNTAYRIIGFVAVLLLFLSVGLKSRAKEIETITKNKSVQISGAA